MLLDKDVFHKKVGLYTLGGRNWKTLWLFRSKELIFDGYVNHVYKEWHGTIVELVDERKRQLQTAYVTERDNFYNKLDTDD